MNASLRMTLQYPNSGCFLQKILTTKAPRIQKTKKLCALVSWWLKNWIFITGDSSNGWISVRFLDSFE